MKSGSDPRIDAVVTAPPDEAWHVIFDKLWDVFSVPVTSQRVEGEITERERKIDDLELLLSSSAWDLWNDYEETVPSTTQSIVEFWKNTPGGRAVLILDGLSLRETPWLLHEATQRGYQIHRGTVCGSELPSDTTSFAKTLGFTQRSALENNGAGASHKLTGARTESLNAAWDYCLEWIASAPDIVLWHHWPDERIHQFAEPGDGFNRLCREAKQQLTSESFWSMINHMCTGRSLIITSDHGYAASCMFSDVTNKEQAVWLKTSFGSSRFVSGLGTPQHWIPPIALSLTTIHGKNQFALGRRKWRSAGGFPTLAHGGLSLMEVAVPFIEISRG